MNVYSMIANNNLANVLAALAIFGATGCASTPLWSVDGPASARTTTTVRIYRVVESRESQLTIIAPEGSRASHQ